MPNAAQEEDWALDDSQLDDAGAPADEATEADEAPQLTEIEKIAAKYGWKPEAEWKGDKSTWTPADKYIDNGFQKQRDASDRARTSDRQARAAQRGYDEIASRLENLTRTTQQLMSEQEARHRAEIKDYFEAEKRKATKADDEDRYQELLDQEREAEALLTKKFQREPEVDHERDARAMLNDPIVGRFLKRNSWIVQDEDAYALAYAVAGEYAAAGHPPSMQVRAAEDMLRREYPERYKAPTRGQTPARQQAQDDDGIAPEDRVPNFDASDEPAERQARVQDPETGRFVPKKDEHLFQREPQQRRQAPVMQAGSRLPNAARATPEQKAWNSLPPEARAIYESQRKSGAIKMGVEQYAKIYHGESSNVLE